jgi:iron uptake system EfeUOB component EfeO/EfeM
VRAATELADAIKADGLAKAQALYVIARQPYKRIEPIVYRFADLQNTIDPLPDYFEKREDDPAFLGYHRLERGLFGAKSLEGLAPIADRLVADLTTLDVRVRALKMTPDVLTESAGTFATQLSRDKLSAEDDRYAETDLSDLEANIDGIGKIVNLLRPIVKSIDPGLAEKIDTTLSATEGKVAKRKNESGLQPNTPVNQGQRKELVAAFTNLADALNQLPSVIGINANGT